MEILSKDMIRELILPHIPYGSRGFAPKVAIEEIVTLILYRLKTGCQWRLLPIKAILGEVSYSWSGVYYHFNNWSSQGVWKKVWIAMLKKYRKYLDLSCMNLDGSHTPVKRGGEAVGYQGRKSCKTTNSLFLTDKQGVLLSISTPQEGQHNDLYQIRELFLELCKLLQESGLELDGLFLNADPGFDADQLRKLCRQLGIELNVKPNLRNTKESKQLPDHYFDHKLYNKRHVIEHANAWIDSYKALINRYETSTENWIALHYMAFVLIFNRKINRNKKV
jgi:transposase